MRGFLVDNRDLWDLRVGWSKISLFECVFENWSLVRSGITVD